MMQHPCKECKHPDCFWVGSYTGTGCDDRMPKTNADRIRTMPDEKLAEWFAGHDAGLIANVLNNDYVEPTKDGWLEWLETGGNG